MSQTVIQELEGIAAFRSMSPRQLEHLAAVLIRRTYSPGQFIFLEGDPASGVWFIARGRVRIIKQSLNGRIQGLCLVDRGKCFGSCPLFDGAVNPANAQALDEVTLLILPQDQLQRLIQEDPELVSTLLDIYSQRLAHLAHLSEGLGVGTAAHRINDCLLAYAQESTPHPVVELTHEKLAELVGTVREVVTRHLSRLEEENVVRTEPGRIVLLDADALSTSCLSQNVLTHGR